MNAQTEILRALLARFGLIIVRSSSEERLATGLEAMLNQLGHRQRQWSFSFGHRRSEMSKDGTLTMPGWDDSTAMQCLPILQEWLKEGSSINDPHRICRGCKKTYKNEAVNQAAGVKFDDDPLLGVKKPSWAPAKQKQGLRPINICPHCGSAEWATCMNILTLRGNAPQFEEGGNFYDPSIVRLLWDIALNNARGNGATILLLPPEAKVPRELLQNAKVIEDSLPTRKEIAEIWEKFFEGSVPDHRKFVFDEVKGQEPSHITARIVDRLCGLSFAEVESGLADAVIHSSEDHKTDKTGVFDAFLGRLAATKAAGLKASGALELMPPEDISNVGGLDILREWVSRRAQAFSPEAKAAGIPPPKGYFLLGPAGGGKSLTAKVTASLFSLPLVRMDIGALFGSYVGQSEAAARLALKTVDAAAPLVLLLDEIDKGLGGTSGGSGDGGTGSRVLGTILTWMQERSPENPVFVVATANRLSGLPPELLRKGRFDEMFFVELPSEEERMTIFSIHLRKRDKAAGSSAYTLATGQLRLAAQAAVGFSGAEIEAAVIEAATAAFSMGQKFSIEQLLVAIRETKPLSLTAKEEYDALKKWAMQRARMASSAQAVTPFIPQVFVPPGEQGKSSRLGSLG